jgi:dTDP-4-amino-4,6-dideoxygalactose transaminase
MRNPEESLALLTGIPAFAEPLHVGRPNQGNRQRFLDRMNTMLDRNWLTNNGPFVQQFEAHLAEFVGVKHCVAMCNATLALEITIRAAGLKDEVIVPAYTFIATAHALQWQEITPVFCDLDPRTHNLDPAKVESLITPRTTGIIGVHVWGRPCPIAELTAIARAHDLTLMFDAAHAFGSTYQGRMIGGFGLAEVFSFHATKFLNSFEGGAVVTNNDELAARIRLMKNFGFTGYDDVVYLGTNGKMTEACAAMGLTNLESVAEFQSANRRNYDCYREGLGDLDGLSLINYDPREQYNYQYVVLEVDETATGLSRDHLVAVLHAENVLARKYFWPGCHQMQPYRSCFPHAKLLLPETERLAPRIIVLPTGVAIGAAEIKTVCDIIRTALTNPNAVREAVARAGKNPTLAQPIRPSRLTTAISRSPAVA